MAEAAATAAAVDTGKYGSERTTEVPLIREKPACFGKRAFLFMP
jgi:hypothetical protein